MYYTLNPIQNNNEYLLKALNNNSNLINNINLNLSEEDLKKIPKTGAFITISNRPLGIIEEYFLAKALFLIRKDIAFLNNHFLEENSPFYKTHIENNTSISISNLLEQGKGVCLFPVGNVSQFQIGSKGFTDSKWDKVILKQIYKLEVPIIPIYIDTEKNNTLKMLSSISPKIYSKKLLSDIVSVKGIKANLIIGKPINKNKFSFNNYNHFGQFLKAKLYVLGSKLRIDIFYKPQIKQKEIVEAIEPNLIDQELNAIADINMIGEQDNFQIFIAKAKKIPLTIQEIGRLREETFRKVGEGTNNHLDLDEYDLHYLHLFLYDKHAKKIVGAYRIGDGKYIMNTIGRKGFYSHSLFKLKKGFNHILEHSIELGRSFVVEEYQNKRLPLFLLWNGIMYYLNNHKKIHYMLGPVSINNTYSNVSKSILIKYIMKYHWDEELAKQITPKQAFKPNFNGLDYKVLIECTNNEVKSLEHIIEDIDPLHNRVPVLLKKYFAQNGKIIGFNVDPEFNDALDGFMITNIKDIPKESFEAFQLNKNIQNAK